MDLDPAAAIALCTAAHRRLLATSSGVDEAIARGPSRLPGWSVGHVLAHLARNAEGFVVRMEGALEGREVPRYPGGREQRNRDIEAGSRRPARDLDAELGAWCFRLEEVWARCVRAGWPHSNLLAGDRFPTTGSPARRLREVEVHHVDLGLGYEVEDWPDEYVAWELGESLARLPHRHADGRDARRLLAGITGRGEWPAELHLAPWL